MLFVRDHGNEGARGETCQLSVRKSSIIKSDFSPRYTIINDSKYVVTSYKRFLRDGGELGLMMEVNHSSVYGINVNKNDHRIHPS